jgi:hypothetical protein
LNRQFVLENINKRLDLPKPLTKRDVIAERCGVRPLVVKSQAESTKDVVVYPPTTYTYSEALEEVANGERFSYLTAL